MLGTDTITEFDAGIPRVHAFRIAGAVTQDDMAAMSKRMNAVFDASDAKVDMLLVFETDQTAEPGASLTGDALSAQVRSLTKVRNYVLANAPSRAGGLVETMGKLMPVDARAFDTEAEALAWLKSEAAGTS